MKMMRKLKIYTKKELLIALCIPHKPHLIDQWLARGIVTVYKNSKTGRRVYTENHLKKLKEYKSKLDEWRKYK